MAGRDTQQTAGGMPVTKAAQPVEPGGVTPQQALAWLRAAAPDILAKIAEVLMGTAADMAAEGFWLGLTSAASVLSGTTGVDWGGWRPGDPLAAEMLAGEAGDGAGLSALLDAAGFTIQGIAASRLDDLGALLARGANAGASVEQIARDITGQLLSSDAQWALTVAITETARAVTAATMSRYAAAGLAYYDILVSPGACPICESLALNNPYPIDDTEAQPPIHPRCRCAASVSQSELDSLSADLGPTPPDLSLVDLGSGD